MDIMIQGQGNFSLYMWPICEMHRDSFFEKIFKNWKKEQAEIDDFFFLSKEEENKGLIIDPSNVICKH